MEACVETSAPLAVNPSPAWTMRVARPFGDGFRMAEELRDVPRPALQTVFGKVLGSRIWEQTRAQAAPSVSPTTNQVADAEISAGMLEYVCKQAAGTLHARGRQAKAIELTVTYTDGESRLVRTRLARPTEEENELAEAATKLLSRLSSNGTRSIDLKVATVELAAVPERAYGLPRTLVSASAPI